jgi:sterol-4alpha-carboxylate 3-dehydrogenase (decarboxylating)
MKCSALVGKVTKMNKPNVKNALIIGGNGFLGKHLTADLFERGYQYITVFDLSISTRTPEFAKTFKMAPLIQDIPESCDRRLEFVQGDIIKDIERLEEVMKKHDTVFHVASPPYTLQSRSIFYNVNVTGTKLIVEACKRAGVKKLILTSSASVLFNGASVQNIDEEGNAGSHFIGYPKEGSYIDYYAETKMLQEKIILAANEPSVDGLHTVAIRPHGIFGPYDYTIAEVLRKSMAGGSGMRMCIGDGSNIVDFTYVRNVTYGHYLAAEKMGSIIEYGTSGGDLEVSEACSTVNGQVYHITNDEPIQFWVFISSVLKKLKEKSVGTLASSKFSKITTPQFKLPYFAILYLAYLLQFIYSVRVAMVTSAYFMLGLVFSEYASSYKHINFKPPFLSPFKVSLAGTHHYYSCAKAKRELGYVPVVNLEDAVDLTVDFYISLENENLERKNDANLKKKEE